jgi:hypothetical protein
MKQLRQTIVIIIIAFLIGAGFAVRDETARYVQAQAATLATLPAGSTATAQLNALRQYTMTHSGATVTVQLTTAYNQAVEAANAATAAPSSGLYAAAQAACGGHAVSTVQAQCNEEYIQSHSTPGTVNASVVQPKLSDYTYHFVAPFLSFDISTILWGVALLLIVALAMPVLRPRPYF